MSVKPFIEDPIFWGLALPHGFYEYFIAYSGSKA